MNQQQNSYRESLTFRRRFTPRKSVVVAKKQWGYEVVWARTPFYVSKVLHLNAGGQYPRQFHQFKDETLMVQSGVVDVEIGTPGPSMETRRLRAGDVFHIPPETVHRIVAVTETKVLQTSTSETQGAVFLLEEK